jgi:hypothetical protein
MGSQSYSRPANVVASLFIVVALENAITGLVNMQIPDALKGVAANAKIACPTLNPLGALGTCGTANNGWYADLLTAAVLGVLAALLLIRPARWERLVYAAAAGWCLVGFLANIVARHDDKALDFLVTFRAGIYLVALAILAVVVAFEWKAFMDESAAERAAKAKTARPAAPARPARRRTLGR